MIIWKTTKSPLVVIIAILIITMIIG